MNAAQLCELLKGELIGDGRKKISGPSQIDDGKPDTVTFLANPKYEEFVYTTDAAAIVVSKEFNLREPINSAIIKVDDVYGAMMFLIEKFSQNGTPLPGISEVSVIHPTSQLGENVSIGAYVTIESGVKIGDRTIIYPGVFIGH
ncbi:MAG TPA: LpxD N-terminal domain-containing protein, partial [Saprospiraceae bacterium]|nr:LpxD N-terminal domain-containing protein [Saprospiraceae bacterium]